MQSRIATLVVIHHPRRLGFSPGASAARRSTVSVSPETHRNRRSAGFFFLVFTVFYLSFAAFRPMIDPTKRCVRRIIETAKVTGEKMRPVNSVGTADSPLIATTTIDDGSSYAIHASCTVLGRRLLPNRDSRLKANHNNCALALVTDKVSHKELKSVYRSVSKLPRVTRNKLFQSRKIAAAQS